MLVPVYNCKDYIEDAVKSVVEQHYEQIQIVLINDGSTDGSEKICNKLAEHYEKIHVIHQDNAGVSVARNAGIEFVISKLYKNNNSYIAFLDADDQWCDTFFDTKVLEILGENHSLVGFQTINCNCQLSRCRSAEPLIEGSHKGGKKSIELYRSQQFTGMFYSCELLQKYSLRFDCNMKYSEDRLFLMQCMTMANKVFLHNKILYKYQIMLLLLFIDEYMELNILIRCLMHIWNWIKSYSFILILMLELEKDLSVGTLLTWFKNIINILVRKIL